MNNATPETKRKIESFTDLMVWREGHKLVLAIYRLTKSFPNEERYALGDQMRRAATSVTSNIAEGFGRHSWKEKVQFYYLAHGSLTELKNQLIISRDVGYMTAKLFGEVMNQANAVHALLRGLLTKSKTFIIPHS